MRVILVASMLMLATLTLAFLAPGPLAQEPAPDAPMGKLYLNGTLLEEDDSDDVCGTIRTFGMEPVVPTNETSKKAYLTRSFFAATCPTFFHFNVTEPFVLSGDATVHFFFACDSQTVLRTTGGSTVRIFLLKNEDDVDDGSWTASSSTCAANSVQSANITIETKDTEFEPDDVLVLEVRYNAASSDDTNVHFKVESVMHNTSIRAAGLPIPSEAPAAANGTGPPANTTAPANTTVPGNTTEPTSPPPTTPTTAPGGAASPTDGAGQDLDEGGRTKDISGEATAGPGGGLVLGSAAVALSAVATMRRRRL